MSEPDTPSIEKNMSDSNIRARKGKSIKNHLFVIYGIINAVINGNADCIDLQVYDIIKCFDALWLQDCMLDIYQSSSVKDDKSALMYQVNQTNLVAVKTAQGLTERVDIPNIVMQGSTPSGLQCSNSVDTLGKKCMKTGTNQYLYKDMVNVPPLACVDDLLGVAKCNQDSLNLNIFLTTQIELKKLKFHVPDKNGKSKCHKLHIGKKSENCPELKVHNTVMNNVTNVRYLGDIINCEGSNNPNIESRVSKGLGIITQIMNLLSCVTLGEHYFQIALTLRESMLVNGITTNAEIWYGLSEAQIKELETVDKTDIKNSSDNKS